MRERAEQGADNGTRRQFMDDGREVKSSRSGGFPPLSFDITPLSVDVAGFAWPVRTDRARPPVNQLSSRTAQP